METMNTVAAAPQMSEAFLKIEKEKREAVVFVEREIQTLMSEGKSTLEAARNVYERVKGNNYRQEVATAKLLEYLAMVNEVDMRKGELNAIGFTEGVLTNTTKNAAANDAKYRAAA